MKRLRIVLLPVLCLFVLLTGCSRFYGNEYLSIADHDAPYAYKEEAETEPMPEQPIIASSYYSLRSAVSELIIRGVEHGQIRLEGYQGDVEHDLKRVTKYYTTEDPLGAYATDYLSCERKRDEDGWIVTVNAVYRRSVSEIASIVPVRGNEAALQKLHAALFQMERSVTLRISGYEEADFNALLTEYCMQNPDVIPELPRITGAVYPETGNVRILEIHMVYDNDRDSLRTMRNEVESVLTSAYNYIRYSRSDVDRLRLMYSYLSSRLPYTEDRENATVYSFLCQGVGDSVSVSSVVYSLCQKAGMDCRIVMGQLDGAPYAWNLILTDGIWYHYDFQEAALSGENPLPKTDEDMSGYDWDRGSVPASDGLPAESPNPEDTP